MKKDSFTKKLAAYVAMCSAFLAAQKECDAQIVYTNVEPDTLIGFGNLYESYSLDLNNDGITDFFFVNDSDVSSWSSNTYNLNIFQSPGVNKIIASSSSNSIIEILLSGDTINFNQNFVLNNLRGPGWFANGPINGFIGLEFEKNNHTYYGWARLYSPNGADYLAVKDYAYNSIADEPIIAGETSCDTTLPPPILVWNGTEIQSSGNGTPQWFLNGDTLSGYNANNISPPLIGNYHVIYSDTLGCHSQSNSFFYMNCDSLFASVSSVSDTVCFNQHPFISASPSNSSLYYQWQINNLNVGNNTVGLYSIQANLLAGNNNLRVIISDPFISCIDTSSTISIYEFPIIVPTITISGDTMISSPASSYSWRNSSNQIVGTNQNYFPTLSGIYRVFVTNDFGCIGSSTFAYFDHCWYLNNSAQNLGASLYCPGANVNDSLSVLFNINYSYQWYLNGVAIVGADSNIFYPNQIGTYNVNVTDALNNCVVYSNGIQLSYAGNPVSFVIKSNDTLFSVSGMENYQWYLNSTPIFGAHNSFYVFNQSGNYSVEIFNELGCSAISQDYFFSNCSIANPQIQNSNGITLCQGESTPLSLITSSGNNVQWFINGDSIVGATTSSMIVNTTGNYSAIISNDSLNCSVETDTISILVYQTTTPVITQIGDTLFSSLPFGNHWSLNSIWITGAAAINYFLIPIQDGTYYVVNTDSNGCQTISVPFIYSSTGIESITDNLYELTVDGKEIIFKIKNTDLIDGELIFYNVLGQKIYSIEINTETLRFNLNEAAGMNFMIIRKDKFFRIEKIILN